MRLCHLYPQTASPPHISTTILQQLFHFHYYLPLSQLWYDLGSLHFKNGDLPKALSAFSKARELLSHLASPPSLLDQLKLSGYITACECVLRRREGGDEEDNGGERTLLERVEELRIGDTEVGRCVSECVCVCGSGCVGVSVWVCGCVGVCGCVCVWVWSVGHMYVKCCYFSRLAVSGRCCSDRQHRAGTLCSI